MTALPRFPLDENVSEQVLPALDGYGLDVVSTTQLGLKGATDPRQLLAATQLGRVVVTHNGSDFRMLHEALGLWAERWGLRDAVRHAGILVIDQASGMKAAAMADVINNQLARHGEPVTNRLFAWNRRQGLVEEPPRAPTADGSGTDASRAV